MRTICTGIITLCLLIGSTCTTAQSTSEYKHQLRISVDEDFINIRGKGTDKAYTAGTFIDYYYEKKQPGFFLERWLPKAGPPSVNIFSTGLMHLVFTPNNTKSDQPIRNDYPYAGALLAHFTLDAYNPEKKYSFQSRIAAGMIGPASGAREIQEFVHRLTGTQQPNGWEYQMPNDILINLQLAAEKQLLGNRYAALNGGGRVYAGTMTDALEAWLLIRAGKMKNYFNGWMAQTSTPARSSADGRWQFYAIAKPSVRYTFYNALLQGGFVLDKYKTVVADMKRLTTSLDYGLVISHGNFCISFTQKVFSANIKGLSSHEVGNISLHFSW